MLIRPIRSHLARMVVMDRRLSAALLVVFLGGGCRTCSDCCDYLPPVAMGQYATLDKRVGGFASTTDPQANDPVEPVLYSQEWADGE